MTDNIEKPIVHDQTEPTADPTPEPDVTATEPPVSAMSAEEPAGAVPPPPSSPSLPTPAPVAAPATPSEKDERLWCMLCHLSGLANYFLPIAGAFLGPLLVWMIKRDEFPTVNVHGKEAANFGLTVLIAGMVVSAITAATCGFGGILFLPLVIGHIYYVVTAGMKANNGEAYTYPYTLRLLK